LRYRPSTIVVTDARGRPIRPLDIDEMLEERMQRSDDRVRLHGGCAADQKQFQIEIRGVSLVVARLLEIHTIGKHVPLDLRLQNAPADAAPAAGAAELGQKGAEVYETERFTCEMRVRAEVSRQVTLDMSAMGVQHANDSRAQGVGQSI
jgi:hypothetical protein